MNLPAMLLTAYLLPLLQGQAATFDMTSVREVKAPRGSTLPVLSQDGKALLFVVEGEKGWSIYIQDGNSGPRLVADGISADRDTMSNSLLVSPISWSRKAIALVTVQDENKNGQRDRDEPLTVQGLDLDSGTMVRLSSPGRTGMNPAWLPGEDTVCYTESGIPGRDPVLVVCRKGLYGSPRIVHRFLNSFVYWLVPSPDGRRLALRKVRAGNPRPSLVVLDRLTGKVVSEIQANSPSSAMVPHRWSNDGKSVFYVDLKSGKKGVPDVFKLEVGAAKPVPLGAGGCMSFLVGPGDHVLLLDVPRRTLPELKRTTDLTSFDIEAGRSWRISKDIAAVSVAGKNISAVTADGRILVARLEERGVPKDRNPGAEEAIVGENMWRTKAAIYEAAAPFAVYKIDHGKFPTSPDPISALKKALGLKRYPTDALGRPFEAEVFKDGSRFRLKSKPYKGWYVEYDSKTRKAVVKAAGR